MILRMSAVAVCRSRALPGVSLNSGRLSLSRSRAWSAKRFGPRAISLSRRRYRALSSGFKTHERRLHSASRSSGREQAGVHADQRPYLTLGCSRYGINERPVRQILTFPFPSDGARWKVGRRGRSGMRRPEVRSGPASAGLPRSGPEEGGAVAERNTNGDVAAD